MKRMLASVLLASLVGVPTFGVPARAQNADATLGGANGPASQQLAPNPGPDAPSPVTGELVPLPGPPPEGEAAKFKLPDCTPPKCGVPQIMTE